MKPKLITPVCPCGLLDTLKKKPLLLSQCCGRYLGDFTATPAPDAASLMRSRYSAFVLGQSAYLQATWHASTRPDDVMPEPGTQWLGLDVKSHKTPDPAHAEVEFIARYRLVGRAVRLHEVSRFVREDGRWYYVDGDLL